MGALLARSGLEIEDVWAGRADSVQLRACLLPEEQPQERVLGMANALLENGLEFVAHVESQMSPFEFDHQVVTGEVDAAVSAARASARA